MGMFDGIEQVTSNQGGMYLMAGQHLLKILALKQPPNLRAGNCFIAELEVVESTREDYPVGSHVSWIRNVTKHKEMALADIKAFLAAVAGIDESDIDAAGADAAVGDAQPFAGSLIRCEAYDKPLKDGEGAFTRTIWTHPDAAAATK